MNQYWFHVNVNICPCHNHMLVLLVSVSKTGPKPTGPVASSHREKLRQLSYGIPIVRLMQFHNACVNSIFSPSAIMMTSSNGNIFRVTGPLCGSRGEFPTQRPVTRTFDVFFDLRPNIRLSKQPWGWWFETPSCPLWRHRNEMACDTPCIKKTGAWHVIQETTSQESH